MLATLQDQVMLPDRIKELDTMAHNLWWSWQKDGEKVFSMLDPVHWETSRRNPVRMLREIEPTRLTAAASDPAYLVTYDNTLALFQRMRDTDRTDTWVSSNVPALASRLGAYFSAEFGLHPTLPIYSGGLGVLSGDHIKESSDLGLPLVAVSLLYRQGYLHQSLSADGWQHDITADLQPWAEPPRQVLDDSGNPVLIEVAFDDPGAPLKLAVWMVEVGTVELYLLDSDVEGNPDWTRLISSRLYGGDQEHRLRQEIVLGIGGVRALEAIGKSPDYWHGNEGHAAFHLLERCRRFVSAGMSFEAAVAQVQQCTVFTSHTPVPAGHDVFQPALMDRYFDHYWPQLGLNRDQFYALGAFAASGEDFNMTALSMRLSGHRNAVSKKHAEVTRAMWHGLWPERSEQTVPIKVVTNGVHLPTWISGPMESLYDDTIGPDWRDSQDNRETWQTLLAVPDGQYWESRLHAKERLMRKLRTRTLGRWEDGQLDGSNVLSAGPFLDSKVLTLGFARRFATYKRATLLFRDVARLAAILNNPEHPVQIVFAGKAHPADDAGKRLIQEIVWSARDPRYRGRIAFAEDYDIDLAEYLVSGVDVWLNNPVAPLEASGTSGMKSAANGVPNLSILDGWWIEGWDGQDRNGWGLQPMSSAGERQDEEEADAIYRLLEQVVVPMYYRRDALDVPVDWVAICKRASITCAPVFSARRMLKDYINSLYLPAVAADIDAE